MDTASLLTALAGKPVPVTLPRIGAVFCRPMSIGQMVQYTKALESAPNDFAAALQSLMIGLLCDEAGAPLFSEADAPRIAEIEFSVAQEILNAILDATGLSAQDAEKN